LINLPRAKIIFKKPRFIKKFYIMLHYGIIIPLQLIIQNMLQEDRSKLSQKTQDYKRAVDSLREEVEAVDSYNQRAEACSDENLRKILSHNANEEREHAAMLIEWMRKNDEKFSKELKDYLFTEEQEITSMHK